MLCVAPGSSDKVVVVKAGQREVDSVREALQETWMLGIQAGREREREKSQSGLPRKHPRPSPSSSSQDSVEVRTRCGSAREFKLRGNPWTATGMEAAMCR